jgi:UDP-N-acetylmuramate--alanine ligase
MDVYAAGETPIDGISKDTLVEGIKRHGHRDVINLENDKNLPHLIAESVKENDIVVCLGAGDITNYANALPAALQDISDAKTRKAS